MLFADIVGFTPLSERLSAAELVALLDRVFARWDALAAVHGLEKIKTIGDAYMVAGGIPLPARRSRRGDRRDGARDASRGRRPARPRSARRSQVRIGIHTGPVVAGVIGRAKFIYDLWGDTVNTASRMESHGQPGHDPGDRARHERLRRRFELQPRGMVEVKGKGPMACYELTGAR